jgi:hypothetical protein
MLLIALSNEQSERPSLGTPTQLEKGFDVGTSSQRRHSDPARPGVGCNGPQAKRPRDTDSR